MNILIVITISLSNVFIRGGLYKKFTNFRFPDKLAHALLFGFCAYLTLDWRYGVLMAIAHRIGQAPAIFDPVGDAHLGSKEYLKWACVVWLRGLVWVAPIVCASIYFNGLQSLYFALPALLMPLCYIGVWKPFGNEWFNAWTVGETAFGACIGLALII
jgi:hypothetical protein